MSIKWKYTCLIMVSLLAIFVQNSVAMEAPANSINIFEVNDSTLNNSIEMHPFFVLDCYEPWCEPCMRLNTTVHKLANDLNGQIAVGQIDMDLNEKTGEM